MFNRNKKRPKEVTVNVRFKQYINEEKVVKKELKKFLHYLQSKELQRVLQILNDHGNFFVRLTEKEHEKMRRCSKLFSVGSSWRISGSGCEDCNHTCFGCSLTHPSPWGMEPYSYGIAELMDNQ